MLDFIGMYIDQDMWFPIDHNPATDRYMELHEDILRPSVTGEEERKFYVDLANVQGDNLEHMRYISLLELIAGTYIAHPESFLEDYVYPDPNDPNRVIVCTELRDTDYWNIFDYGDALLAGECEPHPETYIVCLDHHGIYRWGEEENLYPYG